MDITELLAFSHKEGASDMHLSSGLPPMIRVDGDIRRINVPALDSKEVYGLIYEIMNDKQRKEFEEFLECDFSFEIPGIARFRVNAYNQNRGAAGVFRTIPSKVLTMDDLGMGEIFRQIAEEVEVIFVIANWPHTRETHWQNLLIARAIENQCFIVGVNRIGNDGVGLKYNGSSMVINPLGEVLLQTDKKTEYASCDIDTSMVSKTRKDFPFLEDIRFI